MKKNHIEFFILKIKFNTEIRWNKHELTHVKLIQTITESSFHPR